MLLTLVIVLLLVGVAVVWSIYSNFLTFFSNFSESENYHKAYYASMAALERAELVIKQREPWYVWTGWWTSSINANWNIEFQDWDEYLNDPTHSMKGSDWKISNFSYLSSNGSKWTNLRREINSRTNRIPAEWQWNVDWLLASNDSINFNTMDYENSEIFLLYYDNTYKNPYEKHSCLDWWCTKSDLAKIQWVIRLPKMIKNALGNSDNAWPLDDKTRLSNASIDDDAVVDWQLKWLWKNDANQFDQFMIYSKQSIRENKKTSDDSAFRESDINNNGNGSMEFEFGNSKWNPNATKSSGEITIISPQERTLSTTISNSGKYKAIFSNNNTSNIQLRLSLLNLLMAKKKGIIYPFLEYYVEFFDKNNTLTDIADKYFTINAEWKFDNFQVNTIIHKPTIQESILWNFTVIF